MVAATMDNIMMVEGGMKGVQMRNAWSHAGVHDAVKIDLTAQLIFCRSG